MALSTSDNLFLRWRGRLGRLAKRFPSEKAFLLLAFFAVGALSFAGGRIERERMAGDELRVAIVAPGEVRREAPVAGTEDTPDLAPSAMRVAETSGSSGCTYVGSRNSDKYHLPTCAVAKRIKPENLVCFGNAEEAVKRGYVPGCIR